MCQASSGSPQAQDLATEHAVLLEIVTQHPQHLTSEELVVRLKDEPTGTDQVAIADSLHVLKRSGLLRCNGDVIEPTYAAVRAMEIFNSR